MGSARKLYSYFFPLLMGVMRLLSLFNPKIKQGLIDRKTTSGEPPWIAPFTASEKPWVWFHISSGELEYAKPLLRRFKAENNHRILITYFSPSVKASLQKTKEVDLFLPMPWDTNPDWLKFLRHYKPKVLAIARTDIWPEMIWTSHDENIPIVLFSTTLGNQSWKHRTVFSRWFYKSIFGSLSHISAVTSDDLENIQQLSPITPVTVDGDTRFDQVFFRLSEKRPIKDSITSIKGQPLLVAGSTWPEDEKVLFPGLLTPIRKGLRVIIAPHEPSESHLKDCEAFFKKHFIDTVRYSQADSWNERCVMIVDKVGLLADLYPIATIAFIGGSFKKTIHSVMEPAGCGCLVLMGPLHNNNREALLLKSQGKALVIKDSKHFSDFLSIEISTPQSVREKRKQGILDLMKSCQGATVPVYNKLLQLVGDANTKIDFKNHGRGISDNTHS